MQTKFSSFHLLVPQTKRGSGPAQTLAVILSLALILMSVPALPIAVPKAEAVGTVHVSNLGQSETNSVATDHWDDKVAQSFTTGNATDGYELGSIVFDLVEYPDEYLRARIHSATTTGPGPKIFTLSSPNKMVVGENIFDAPNNTTLASNTEYYIVLGYVYTPDDYAKFSATTNDGEDSSGDSSWSLANRYQYNDEDDGWEEDGDYALRTGIYGRSAPTKIIYFNAEGDDDDVDLSWTTSSYGGSSIIKHQYIQKLSSASDWPATWTDIPNSHNTGSNRKAYTINDTVAGNQYDFKIRAINALGTSTDSDVVSAATQPATPVGNATSTFTITRNSILFGWTDPSNDSITNYRYEVDKYDSDDDDYDDVISWQDIPDSHATTTTHTATGLEGETTYRIRIRAENDAGESDYYEFADVTTLPALTPTLTAVDPDGDDIDSDNPLKIGETATITIAFSPTFSGSDVLVKGDLTLDDSNSGTFGDLVIITAGEEYDCRTRTLRCGTVVTKAIR